MSKIGKKPINIPDNVEVKRNDGILELKGPKGFLSVKISPYVTVEVKDKNIFLNRNGNFKQAQANWGTCRSLLNNAIIGVSEGFNKILEMEGVGYRANMEGKTLVLTVGLSHLIKFNPPEDIEISVDKNVIKITGSDKALVGQVAAEIRAFKKPEPYKGKGIRYRGEIIRKKAGKKAVSSVK